MFMKLHTTKQISVMDDMEKLLEMFSVRGQVYNPISMPLRRNRITVIANTMQVNMTDGEP